MGNPHPTKSKPIKIGWKHTGAPGIRRQAKIAKGKAIDIARKKGKAKRMKATAADYWSKKF